MRSSAWRLTSTFSPCHATRRTACRLMSARASRTTLISQPAASLRGGRQALGEPTPRAMGDVRVADDRGRVAAVPVPPAAQGGATWRSDREPVLSTSRSSLYDQLSSSTSATSPVTSQGNEQAGPKCLTCKRLRRSFSPVVLTATPKINVTYRKANVGPRGPRRHPHALAQPRRGRGSHAN
jgi:hypothetical protein